jgi:hypothetical protein
VPPLPAFSDAFIASPDNVVDARCCSESPSFQLALGAAKGAWDQRRVKAQEPVGAPAGRLGEVGSASPAIFAEAG